MTNNHVWDSSKEPSCCFIHEHQVECVRTFLLFFVIEDEAFAWR